MTRAESLGLVELTSQTQANNGTICYHDPVTNCDYMRYESGYVRRSYQYKDWRTGKVGTTIYQVNRTKLTPKSSTYNGRTYNYHTTERILEMDANKRMDMLLRSVINYRNTVKQDQLKSIERYKENQRRITSLAISDCVSMFFEGMVDLENTVNDIKESLKEAKANGLTK